MRRYEPSHLDQRCLQTHFLSHFFDALRVQADVILTFSQPQTALKIARMDNTKSGSEAIIAILLRCCAVPVISFSAMTTLFPNYWQLTARLFIVQSMGFYCSVLYTVFIPSSKRNAKTCYFLID